MEGSRPAEVGPRQWALWVLMGLLCVGVGIGVYLSWHHENELYGDASVALNCPQNDEINCDMVNTSEASELLGTPLGTLGAALYLSLLVLVFTARTKARRLLWVFGAGVFASLFSGWLYYVSVVQIGFLCEWCMRLYAINLAIPALAWIGARRSPLALWRAWWGEQAALRQELTQVALVMGAVFVVVVGAQRGYRATLERAEAPTAALAEAPAAAPAPTAAPAVAPAVAPLQGASPLAGLKRLTKGSPLKEEPFSWEARPPGKPAAFFFWAPGYAQAEAELIRLAAFLQAEAPNVALFAVMGRGKAMKNTMAWEATQTLQLPEGVEVLVDEEFAVSKAQEVSDYPNVMVFDAKGELLAKKIKSLEQVVAYSPRRLRARELFQALSAGESVQVAPRLQPAYPADELIGACAPPVEGINFRTGARAAFKPAELTRPTFLMFWSSTCKHCQKEIPALLQHHEANKGSYDVITVTSIKEDSEKYSHREVTQKYLERLKIPWQTFEDVGGSFYDPYRVVSTPTTFLISPGGRVEGVWYYAHQDMDKVMAETLPRLKRPDKACEAAPPWPRAQLALTTTSPTGEEAPLSTLLGKPTMVHFWATWCVPCQKELPSLLRFRDRLEALGGQMILISTEGPDDKEKIASFGEARGLALRSHYNPRGGLAERVDLSYSVPRTFLLDAQGQILNTRYGEQDWDDPAFSARMLARLGLRATAQK